MARIDRILAILLEQGGNELRMGTDREPKMLAYGTAKRFNFPATSEEMLRDLLGEILTPEREEAMRARGRLDVPYESAEHGTYQATLTHRAAGGFDVIFRRSAARAMAAALEPEAPPLPSARVAVAEPVDPVGPTSAPFTAAPAAPVTAAVLPPVTTATADLTELVAHAAARRASDLHLADGAPPVVRIDGTLQRVGHDHVNVLRLLGLQEAHRARLAQGRSVDLGLDIADIGRVRIHVFQADTGLAAAIRLVPRAAPSLASLGLPVPLDELIDLPHGLVLLTGAAGSGKSTTLAALAQEAMRRRSIVLVTLEDPIEYTLAASETSILRRRQVGRDCVDFATGLRDALREDPDVILIGEMRDPETIALALTAAETGHLVLASLHSRSAASAVERIVDSYAAERAIQIRTQLADALRAVVAQRLLPRARGGGRVLALEVMRTTHAIAALIRDGKSAQLGSMIQSGRREGMITLERCLADRVQAGEVRLEDARAAANDATGLALQLQAK